jgi:hypothetical protein
VPLVERKIEFSGVGEGFGRCLNAASRSIDGQEFLEGSCQRSVFQKAPFVSKVGERNMYSPSFSEFFTNVIRDQKGGVGTNEARSTGWTFT